MTGTGDMTEIKHAGYRIRRSVLRDENVTGHIVVTACGVAAFSASPPATSERLFPSLTTETDCTATNHAAPRAPERTASPNRALPAPLPYQPV